jgi:transcriptional repressor NrdR
VSLDSIERIVQDTVQKLRCADSVEVTSARIGDMVAEELKKLDKVAYIRFASVFKHFVDVDDFKREMRTL